MYKFLGLFAVCTVVFGCVPIGGGNGGGNGDDGEILDSTITNNPTFELSYSPPVEWTAPAPGGVRAEGQMKTLDIASKVAREMIHNALLDAMVKQGVLPPKNMNYGLDSIEGQAITATENITAANAGDGIIDSGTVANICVFNGPSQEPPADGETAEPTGCTSLTPNIIKDQEFTIKDGPTLSGKQWKDIASDVETKFRDENVDLKKSIKVSAN